MRSTTLLLIAFGLIAVAFATSDERATCSGSLVTNSDGTVSCVVQTGTTSTGQPIIQVTNQNTGVVTYVTQTGTSLSGQPIYTVTNSQGQALAPAPAPAPAPATTTCTGGTLVTNTDGTRSCVVTVGKCASGYPLYKVTNINTGVTTYVAQTGVNSLGQPIMTPTNQNCQPLSG